MDIKTNPVNEEHQAFIAKCIKRQNLKKFTNAKTVALQALALMATLVLCISFICLALHIAAYYQNKDQLETQALIQQFEKGEHIEMTARVGGQHD